MISRKNCIKPKIWCIRRYGDDNKPMKTRLLITWAIVIMIIRVTAIVERQTAQAFPCVGGSVKEYCTGYHDGAVQGLYKNWFLENRVKTADFPVIIKAW